MENLKLVIESNIEEKIKPVTELFNDLSRNFDVKIEPIRNEVESAKSYIEKEMMAVKESWDNLDKTISDTQGAMEIAKQAKESLGRLETEVIDAIKRVDGLMSSLRETTISTDSNLEKINLTIKLIDEARERVKSVQTPVDNIAVVSDELLLTSKEILEDPDTSDVGFDLEDLLGVMIKHKASDLHIKAGVPPTVRLEGDLIPVGNQILSEEDCKKLVLSSMSPVLRKQLAVKHEVDFAYSIPEARFRANAFVQQKSVSAAYRLLWNNIPSIEDLCLPPILRKFCDYRHGPDSYYGSGRFGQVHHPCFIDQLHK